MTIISGIGTWFPQKIRTNNDWSDQFITKSKKSNKRDLLDIKVNNTADEISIKNIQKELNDPFVGSVNRRVADRSMTNPNAETAAAWNAIHEAKIDVKDIGCIISWSAVPERIVPPSAPKIAHNLSAKNAYAIGMDAACATPLAQILHAKALIESGQMDHVLLTQSHLMTRVFGLGHPASPGIGDCATALILSKSKKQHIKDVIISTDGSYYDAVTWCRSSNKEEDPNWWKAGSDFYLGSHNKIKAGKLILSTVNTASETIKKLLLKNNLTVNDISGLASVQPRKWVPDAIKTALNAKFIAPNTFEEFAHLGGCGMIVNLLECKKQLKENSNIILYAQGAGFTFGAGIITI